MYESKKQGALSLYYNSSPFNWVTLFFLIAHFGLVPEAESSFNQCQNYLSSPTISSKNIDLTRVKFITKGYESKLLFEKEFTKTLRHSKLNINSHNLVLLQTAVVSNRTLEEVLEYANHFPDTGFEELDAMNSLIIQTSFWAQLNHPNLDPHEIIDFFKSFPVDENIKNSTPRAVKAQTAYLSGASSIEVTIFFDSFPKTPYALISLMRNLIIQTSFLTGKDIDSTKKIFKRLPKASSLLTQNGVAIVNQTSFELPDKKP